MNTDTFETNNGIYCVYKNDAAFYSCLQKNIAWDFDLIQSLLKYIHTDGTILDIGSHIGSHAIQYSLARPNCTIHAFEPQLKIRELFEHNVKLNNINNIIIHNIGCGHTSCHCQLAFDFTSDGYSKDITVNYNTSRAMNFGGLGITNDPRGEKIEIKPLDTLEIKDVVFIKIDVEGAETLVVYGGQNTIKKWRPILFIEQSDKNLTSIYTDKCPELKTFSIYNFLKELNYKRIEYPDSNFLYIPM